MTKKAGSVFLCLVLLFSLSAPVYAAEETTGNENAWDFIVHIFVPKDNYFNNKIAEVNNRVKEKLGGVAYLYHMINYFFKTLQSSPNSDFNVSVPNNFFYAGYQGVKVDFFEHAKPFIRILKAAITCFICIVTAIACYRKLIVFFDA